MSDVQQSDSKSDSKSAQGKPSVKLPWWKKLLFAVVTTAACLALLEGLLALLGVSRAFQTHDPYVGFASDIPLLQEVKGEDGQRWMTTAENKRLWFNDQSFPSRKPPGTFRVFCVGGSTTYGRPYWDPTSYSGWLRELLPAVDDSRQWEVVNAGGVSYASYRVALVMEELARYEPDLFIVYTAHNEFLERRTYPEMFRQPAVNLKVGSLLSRTRTWTLMENLLKGRPEPPPPAGFELPGEVDEVLNHTVGPTHYHRDDDWRRQVLQHYEFNLTRLVQIARQAGAEIMFVTPASNIKDCSPFKSELDPSLSEADAARFWQQFEQAEAFYAQDRLQEALTAYRPTLDIESRYAHIYYYMGRLQLRLGQADEAEVSLQRALEEDVCPLRAPPEIVQAIRRVARRAEAPIVDFGGRLRQLCQKEQGHQCLGAEYFLDHVHPTIEVHRQLALWLLEAMQQAGLARGSAPSPQVLETVAGHVQGRIDDEAQGVALRNLAKVLHWAGKFDEAGPVAQQALELINGDPESLYIAGDCLGKLGRGAEAIPYLKEAIQQDDSYRPAYLQLGVLLAEQGASEEAKSHLEIALLMQPDDAYGLYQLGLVHWQLKEYDQAAKVLQETIKLVPDDSDAIFLLARCLTEMGQAGQAVQQYERLLELRPQDALALNQLGLVLLQQHRPAEAVERFEAALQVAPDYEEAGINLEMARNALQSEP